MNSSEATIRSFLAGHLQLIDHNLVIISEEYGLPNQAGSRGRVDILARDEFGNFVVIEIKKSNQTSREALHEVLKYAGLLKQNFHVRDSEIRIIIVSTDWRELIIPFTDYFRDCPYQLEGLILRLDADGIPEATEQISPLSTTSVRLLSPTQYIYFFQDEAHARDFAPRLAEAVQHLGLSDLAIFLLKKNRPINPHAIYLAFQRQSMQTYLSLLQNADNGLYAEILEVLEYNSKNNEPEESGLRSTEDYLFTTLSLDHVWEDMEIGYPEKLDSLLSTGWNRIDSWRYGFLANDPRLTDETLLDETKGLLGTSQAHYENFCLSSQKARLLDIELGVANTLSFNGPWMRDVNYVLRMLRSSNREYQLKISTVWRGQILDSLYYMSLSNPLSYMPHYSIEVDYLDGTGEFELYFGSIYWTGNEPNLKKLFNVCFDDNVMDYFTSVALNAVESKELLNSLGLSYHTDYVDSENETKTVRRKIKFRQGKVVGGRGDPGATILDFMSLCVTFLHDLNTLYEGHMMTLGTTRMFGNAWPTA